jgi:hypothetical protein
LLKKTARHLTDDGSMRVGLSFLLIFERRNGSDIVVVLLFFMQKITSCRNFGLVCALLLRPGIH